MSTIVFARKTFQIPTPRHNNQSPDEIRVAFVEMIKANNAVRSQIRQAALGEATLIVTPSSNPHANYVFKTVLEAMIASIQQAAAAKAIQAAEAAHAAAAEAFDQPQPPLTEVEGGDASSTLEEYEEQFA